ncbi:MAG TPA: glycosyltransferase family 2 protein [Eubacteriaceae bacterium]|nr:glycosyltransferase family 2 protein [Eubacteriaceae bacterium]
MKDTLIVIPAYNEEKTIGNLLKTIIDAGYNDFADILVVNDKSQDQTIRSIVEYEDKVILIKHVFNMGYGAALKTGYVYATKYGYQYVIQLDGDGQHDAKNIERLHGEITAKNAPDIVIGSRFLEGSETFSVSAVKMWAIRFFRLIIKLFAHGNITDPTSGLQALNRKAFSYYAGYVNFDLKYPDANMIIKMLLMRYRIEEIPAIMHPRKEGVSIHSGIKPVFYMILMMLSTFTVVLQYKFLKAG